MATTTTVINAQSFGTSTNTGDQKFANAPVTLQSGTTYYTVSVKVVLGSGQPADPTRKLRVWYTTNVDSVTAALAPEQLGQSAHFVELNLDRNTIYRDSPLEIVTGGYFNCWVSAPVLSVASAVTVKLIEGP